MTKAISFIAWFGAILFSFSICFSISLVNIGLVFLLFSFFLQLILESHRIRHVPNIIDYSILIFVLVWSLACIINPVFSNKIMSTSKIYHFLPLYLLLWVRNGRFVVTALYSYLFGALLAACLGLGLYLYWNIINPLEVPQWMSWFGLKIYNYFLYNRYRAYGVIHPLTYAEVLVPAFLIFVSLFLSETKLRRKIFFFVAVLIIQTAILANKQRGPWVGTFVGLVLLIFWNPRRMVLFLFMLLACSFIFFQKDILNRFITMGKFQEDQSIMLRLSIWKTGWYVAKKNIFFGVGPHGVKDSFRKYSSENDFPKPPGKLGNDVHNLYLSELVQKGMIGLFAIVLLFASFLWVSWISIKATSAGPPLLNAIGKGQFSSLVAFCIYNFTERAFDDSEVVFLFMILVAFSILITNLMKIQASSPNKFIHDIPKSKYFRTDI